MRAGTIRICVRACTDFSAFHVSGKCLNIPEPAGDSRQHDRPHFQLQELSLKSRKSGVLLHISSLPSDFGIGDMGKGAYVFADFLASAEQSVWQLLPINPISAASGNSPYSSFSAFAGNPLLIGPDLMVQDGYVSWNDLVRAPAFESARTDYDRASVFKHHILDIAYERFLHTPDPECRYEAFAKDNAHWLDDYAMFVCLKEHFGGAPWNEWPKDIRDRDPSVLNAWGRKLADRISREKFCQFLFFRQWFGLKAYCNRKKIEIIGDIPIYVSYDSADVWANPQYFKLDEDKKPSLVAGVPPDYFSETGQLWGNPVYCWNRLKETSYSWWLDRMEHNLRLFDRVRLDHFRGFVAYWEVPVTEKTAVNGKWVEAPANEFFSTLLRRFPTLPIIAEDLGVITPDVKEVMTTFDMPGMKLLLFAFGGDTATNPYIPHNHVANSIAYTGTHDNNTVKGWYVNDASDSERKNVTSYYGRAVEADDVAWLLIRSVMMSVA
ncbi:MAG: 4-alpha-glucanotransferase, partial [Desulfobacteraceae bacterium]|nr:4-alpha-glucanotransferase [Desulfobacteraceae bacterium]